LACAAKAIIPAAIAVGLRLGTEAKVVTLLCASGLKYLGPDVCKQH
jgi:hypothetical protein